MLVPCFTTVSLEVNSYNSLGLSFCICKMRMMIPTVGLGGSETVLV